MVFTSGSCWPLRRGLWKVAKRVTSLKSALWDQCLPYAVSGASEIKDDSKALTRGHQLLRTCFVTHRERIHHGDPERTVPLSMAWTGRWGPSPYTSVSLAKPFPDQSALALLKSTKGSSQEQALAPQWKQSIFRRWSSCQAMLKTRCQTWCCSESTCLEVGVAVQEKWTEAQPFPAVPECCWNTQPGFGFSLMLVGSPSFPF